MMNRVDEFSSEGTNRNRCRDSPGVVQMIWMQNSTFARPILRSPFAAHAAAHLAFNMQPVARRRRPTPTVQEPEVLLHPISHVSAQLVPAQVTQQQLADRRHQNQSKRQYMDKSVQLAVRSLIRHSVTHRWVGQARASRGMAELDSLVAGWARRAAFDESVRRVAEGGRG